MHISLTGRLGSGKSTIAHVLNSVFGFQIYSTGAIHREIALKRKVSTLEMNQLMSQDLSYDHAIDDAVTKISVDRKNETIVFDSRMAWKFAVNSFKVFITVDPLVAATRVMTDSRGEEEVYTNVEEAKSKLIERGKLENERFKAIYGVDYLDYLNYNLVIDSTYAPPDEIAAIIYERYRDYCISGGEACNIMMSPTSLYPLARISDIDVGTLNKYEESKEYLHNYSSIIVFNGYHFFVEGHYRVLAAIINKEEFINVELVNTEKYPFFKNEENLISELQATGISSVYEFEEIGKFRYKSYPSFYIQK